VVAGMNIILVGNLVKCMLFNIYILFCFYSFSSFFLLPLFFFFLPWPFFNRTKHKFQLKYLEHLFSLHLSNNMEVSALHVVHPIRLDTVENLTFISSIAHSHKEYHDLEIKAISGSLSPPPPSLSIVLHPISWTLLKT
jgi:hypothetical protein